MPPLVKAGCLTMTKSPLAWTSAIAADARPWTTDATDDLERICDYIADTSPNSARGGTHSR